MPKKSPAFRTNVVIPRQLHKDVLLALSRRAKIAAQSGQTTPTTFSGFVREKAIDTVNSFR